MHMCGGEWHVTCACPTVKHVYTHGLMSHVVFCLLYACVMRVGCVLHAWTV